MISWDDFWTEILPTLCATREVWEFLASYEFSDDGVVLAKAAVK